MKTTALCLILNLAAACASGAQTSTLVSGASRVSATGGGGSFQPVLSADGRFVAFISQANNLVTNDGLAPCLDAFLRDRVSGGIALVSVSTNGAGGGDDSSAGPSVSADGRYVAFQSAAGNLATNDTNSLSDVFLRDTVAGTMMLVSRELTGRTAPGRASIAPLLSTNGRWLVFESTATNLVANDTNGAADIFIYDRDTGMNSLVSANAAGNGSRVWASQFPSMTPDGRFVAFVNFFSNVSPVVSHVFVRELQSGVTMWASSNAAALLGSFRGVAHPILSADGSAVFFHAYNISETNLYRFTLADGATGRPAVFASALAAPSPGADGRFVAFESNGVVRVADAQTSNSVIASVTLGGAPAPSAEGPSRPVLSADGTKVCFLSSAGGLTADPTNGLAQLYQRDLTAGVTLLLSKDTNGAASGDLAAIVPAISADGGIVAFESTSATMVANDFNLATDVFVRDVAAGTTALLSGRDKGLPSGTAVAAAMVFTNGISADGRYVLYGSFDNGLFPGDTNDVQDIFVRDTVNGTVEAVSVSATGGFTNTFHCLNAVLSAGGRHAAYVISGAAYSYASSVFWRDLQAGQTRLVADAFDLSQAYENSAPIISVDGRWVAFQTTKPTSGLNPSVPDGNGYFSDIILRDMLAGTNTVISRNRFGTATGNGASSAPMFSLDGRWLAFVSTATDLTTNAVSGTHLFVRDLVSHVTVAASAVPPSPTGPGYFGGAVFSRDSRFIAFNSPASYVTLFSLLNRTSTVACVNCRNPSLSADARWIAAEDTFNLQKIRLRDRSTGAERALGTEAMPDVPGGPRTYYPILSGNARYVLFLARPFNQTPPSLTPRPNLYLHNIARGVTARLPVSLNGDSGNGPAYLPQLAADDRTLVFASFASDLTAGDYNDRRDVFTLRLAGPDTDGDGLDDDGEFAYFGNLARDGDGDFDGDGQNDRDEMLAGTDPTNQGSILRVLTLASVSGNSATVIWESVAGRHYEVQFKDDVAAGWSTLPGQVTATGATAFKVDDSAPRPAERFYRVVLVP